MKHIFIFIFTFSLLTALQAQETVTFQFANASIIGTPPNSQLQFDVEIKATAAGTFHSNGQIYFNYNTAGFGSSIFGSGKVAIQRSSLLSGTVDVFGTPTNLYDIILNDNSADIFAITWNSAFTGVAPNTGALKEVLTSYLTLVQITIDIADPSELAGIDFVENLMNEQQFFRQVANNDLQYVIPNNYDNSLSGQALNNGILAVDLLSFSATAQKNAIGLNWSAAKESSFDGYELQRSKDGKNFQKITFVKGKNGLSIQGYAYTDFQIEWNQTYYYRLKMLDLDGSFEYSATRKAILYKNENEVTIYPNPTRNSITVKGNKEELSQIIVYDLQGKQLTNINQIIQKNATTVELDMSAFPNGVYFVRTKTKTRKVLKTD